MKNATLICICTLAFCSAAGLAQTPTEAPVNLAAILSQPVSSPARGGACGTSLERMIFAAKPPRAGAQGAGAQGTGSQKDFCQANCGSGSPVSCSGAGSCSAFDQNCDFGEQGHVTCGTTTIWCANECQCNDTPQCCTCYDTGDCFACCRCEGHGPGYCAFHC